MAGLGFESKAVSAWVAVALLMIAAVGCGGSSSSGTSGSSGGEPEASTSFLKLGAKNKIPKFGEEADKEEREAASAVLGESLQARAAGEWAKQCETLTAGRINRVKENGAGGSCVNSLKSQALPLSKSKEVRVNTMTGPIDALRVEGDRGYALYHGTKGKDYVMAMKKEDDEWKVSSLTESELP